MAWLISYPADVVKSRLQAQDSFKDLFNNGTVNDSYHYMTRGFIWKIVEPSKRFDQPLLYKSGMDCFHQGLKYEGWQFCWRGLGPTLIRAFPANAALFFTYQFVSDYLYRLDPDNFRHLGNSARRQPQASSWIFRVWISWLSYVEPFSVKDE